MRRFSFLQSLVWNLEGAGGGAGGEGGGGGAPGGGDGAGGLVARAAAIVGDQQQQQQQTPEQKSGQPPAPNGAYYPDGMPETFRGQNDKETIDKFFADFNGRPRAPEKPDDYKLELPDDFKKKFGELSGDDDQKILGLWRNVCHKNGMSNAQYQAGLVDLYAELDKAGMIDNGPDPDAELEKLYPKTGDLQSRKVAAGVLVNEAAGWIVGLESKKLLTKPQAARLTGLMETADGVQIIRTLMTLGNQQGLTGGGLPGASAYTQSDADNDMKDERYSTLSPKHDPKFRKEVDEKMRSLPRKKLMANGRLG